jgi:cell division protein FtsZ
MAEFDEVGRTVENFASEDATVVIGTVLDPDMQDDVRVTVVATGLNRAAARQSVRGHEREPMRTPIKLVRNATTGQPEFGHEDFTEAAPASTGGFPGLRGRSSGGGEAASKPEVAEFGGDSSYLDIPAFLRRQAD